MRHSPKVGEALHEFSGYTASVCVLRPESRGSVHITSSDPERAPEIRVNGVQRLRVMDGSVMPRLVSGSTSAAVIMVAEKVADMILGGL